MKIVHSPLNAQHDPKHFLVNGSIQANPEVPQRAEMLLHAAENAGHGIVDPADHGTELLGKIHTRRYLTFLERIHERWQRQPNASDEVIPNVHPIVPAGGYPDSAAGQAGFHMTDTACPISKGTWDAVRAAANAAIHAADMVMRGDREAYALCRPPGHHASSETAGGFCYLNNSALAAQHLRRNHDKVAVLDVDVHHGNGTQEIFYRRADVLTVSLHADPVRFYPFFWGHASETGADEGEGFNLNLPQPRRTADDDYLKALHAALERITDYGAEALVVALGLDAYEGDPFEGLAITTPGFGRIAEAIAGLELPTVLVQEGGYLSPELGDNLVSFLDGFARGR